MVRNSTGSDVICMSVELVHGVMHAVRSHNVGQFGIVILNHHA